MRLCAQALDFEYPGPVPALRQLELALEGPALVSLIGPNGCGKSTLLRLCAGLLVPKHGQVRLDGAALHLMEPKLRARRVALVPQFLPSLPEVQVEDFVLSGRYAHLERWNQFQARDLELAREALRACDALEWSARSMAELSGGQRQRVLIARALAQEAEVLLVDEPTSALDPEHQIQVFELLDAQRQQGRLVLAATHDLNLAAQYSTQVVLLNQGSVHAQGSIDAVLRPSVLSAVYGPHLAFECAGDPRGSYPVVRAARPQGKLST